MLSSSSSSNSSTTLVVAGATATAAAGLLLGVLQTDACSRLILSPESLQRKRQAEYTYRWSQALAKAALRFQYACLGGRVVSDEKRQEELLLKTSYPHSDAELDALVERIVTKKQLPNLRVARIGADKNEASREYYVWLYDSTEETETKLYQLPLTKFGLKLAAAFDKQITTDTFCFVADASAGVASQLIVDLISETPLKLQVGLILDQPLWMAGLAVLAENRVVNRANVERLLFAFCRLEALRATSAGTTILVRLPGQATTPMLLPLCHKVFPDDRHLFCYSGCVRTAGFGLTLRQQQTPRVSASVPEALVVSDSVSFTTPLTKSLQKSANVMPPYAAALASLPLSQADTVETWMASVDAFFQRKEEEKKNGYLPYVFKLDFVLRKSIVQPTLETGTDEYWSLRSLLQFVTGSRSRELPSETMDAAISFVQSCAKGSIQSSPLAALSAAATSSAVDRKAIENSVFQHKLILIENKILKDTVLPAEHWTLKAAAKQGCACCLPEEDEEEPGLTSQLKSPDDGPYIMVSPPKKSAPTSGYVDGKTMFAFDPTRFS